MRQILIFLVTIMVLVFPTNAFGATSKLPAISVSLELDGTSSKDELVIGCDSEPCLIEFPAIALTVKNAPAGTIKMTELITDSTGNVISENKKQYMRAFTFKSTGQKIAINRPVWKLLMKEGNYQLRILYKNKQVANQAFRVNMVAYTERPTEQPSEWSIGWFGIGQPLRTVQASVSYLQAHGLIKQTHTVENGTDILSITVTGVTLENDQTIKYSIILQNTSSTKKIGKIEMLSIGTEFKDELNRIPTSDLTPSAEELQSLSLEPGETKPFAFLAHAINAEDAVNSLSKKFVLFASYQATEQ